MANMTKKQVDQRAMDILHDTKLCDREKQLRYFGIGRMYHQIREFQEAKKYLESYVKAETCSKNLADGYKILASTLEFLGDFEGSLNYLKLLYQITESKAVLLKICDFLESGYGKNETPESREEWFDLRSKARASGILNNSMTSTPPQPRLLGDETGLYSPLSALPSPAAKLTNGIATSSPISSKLRINQPKFNVSSSDHHHSSSSSNHTQLMTQVKTMEAEIKLEFKNIKESVAQSQIDKEILAKAIKDEVTIAVTDIMRQAIRDEVKLVVKDTVEQAFKEQINPRLDEFSNELSDLVKKIDSFSLSPSNEVKIQKVFQEMVQAVDVDKTEHGSGESAVSVPVTVSTSNAQKPLFELFKKPLQPGAEPKPTTAPALVFGTQTPVTKTDQTEGSRSNSLYNADWKTPDPNFDFVIPDAPVDKPLFSFNSTFAGFGDLAKQAPTSGFSFSNPSQPSIFNQSPKPIFGTPQVGSTTDTTPRRTSTGRERRDSDVEDDFVPTAEFTPVIPLPALVEVVKGDEDEHTMYEIRAKLYRFDFEKKEWKERGIGMIKILQHKDMKNKARIVMWREQIHKLACNHWITSDMEIEHHQNSGKQLKWSCVDFSEGDKRNELLVCKFGKEEHAEEFKKVFQEMVQAVDVDETEHGSGEPAVSVPVTVSTSNAQKPLSELFKKPEGSWVCTGCYLANTKEQTICPSCETPQPGTEPKPTAAPTPAFTPQFSFGFKPLVPTLPKKEEENTESTSCPGCIGCDPDAFDFSKLDNRKLPTYPEQNMSLEEYTAYKAKSKVEFSFTTPSFTPFQQQATTAPFTFASSVDQLQPQAGFSVTQPTTNIFNSSGSNANSSFGFATQPFNSLATNATGGEAEGGAEIGNGEEEDEDEEPPMYEGKCKISVRYPDETDYTDCGEGQINISYDGDSYCSRFSFFSGDDDLLVDHIIAADTAIHKIGDTKYAWCGLTESDSDSHAWAKIELEATFETEADGATFQDRFSDSQEIASYAGITEGHLLQNDEDEEDEGDGN